MRLARVAHAHGALFHTDAVQAASCVPLDMQRDGIDLLSLSGHKLYGPKGIGALVCGDNVPLTPLIHALRGVMLEGIGLFSLLGDVAIVAVWGCATFALALRWFRWT